MLYLRSFNFASFNSDLDFETGLNCYNSKYPFGILSYHRIERIDFDNVTIFYGGNGCGKTTALNIISEKLKLQRDTLFNKSNFFEKYLKLCRYGANSIPKESRIITSDDVFEFTMNLRYLNEGINRQREELSKEYDNLKNSCFKLKRLSDYDEFKRTSITKKINKSFYIEQNMQNNVKEHSNGESAFIYFTEKIQENALYLLDEPENSLSPEKQQELLKFIEDSVRFYNCQFIIATHSPFILSLKYAKIYDFDENPCVVRKWTDLKNVRDYYNFFKSHEEEFQKPVEVIKRNEIEDKYAGLSPYRRYLTRELYSDLGKEVFDRLKEIWDYDDFIVGTMNDLRTEKDLQKMLNFLIETGTKNSDDVIPYSIKIRKGLV